MLRDPGSDLSRHNPSKKRRGRWRARPVASALLRVLVFALPIAASVIAAVVLSHLLPDPDSTLDTIVWWGLFVVGAVLPFIVIERFARRLLPLALLLRLTLLFPDEAPSRVAVARRAGRVKDLQKRVAEAGAHGVHDEPTVAAEKILGLIAALGAHDRRTRGHSERVRTFTDLLAGQLDLTAEDRERLRWGALLHDIGKLSVPAPILNKPGGLDGRELEVIHRHPIEGLRIAAPIVGWLGPWTGAIEHHHERWDGKGYPHGLTGEDISLGGRIIAVADSYETMTAARPYKKPLSATAARAELASCAGKQFDPALVRAFLNVSIRRLWWAIGGVAFLAQLPALGQLSFSGAAQRFGNVASGVASAAALVAGLMVGGLIAPPSSLTGGSGSLAALAEPSSEPMDAATEAGTISTRRGDGSDPDRMVPSSGAPQVNEPPAPPAPPARPRASSDATHEPGSEPGPAPNDPSGDPDGHPPGDPGPAVFTASGSIRSPNPLYGAGGGVTQNEFLLTCAAPSTQGIDGWAFVLSQGFGGRGTVAAVSGRSAVDHDLDMLFYSASCDLLGAAAGAEADPSAPVPTGTRFILVSQSAGVDTAVSLRVTA